MARFLTRRRLMFAAALVALAVAACNTVVLARGAPLADDRDRGEAPSDCALVLGAGVHADGSVSAVLEDRLETGLALYRDRRVARILVSGDHGTDGYDEVNAMRRWLEARGVPPGDVFLDHAGFDTYSSMWRARDVFRVRRMIVVTQRFHLPRALFIARSLGLEASGAPADRRPYRGAVYHELREVLSRTRAVIDVTTRRVPRHAGAEIAIAGDGRATRDRSDEP
jgi:vancomycin permeability regulator SanA